MQDRDSRTESIWQGLEPPALTATSYDERDRFDVAVIGAGITGLTTALLLQQAGKKCILLEARNIGFGTSSGTTGHLNTYLDTPYHILEKRFGEGGARSAAGAAKSALALVERLVKDLGISCGFRYLEGHVFSQTPEESDRLDKMIPAAVRAGLQVNEDALMPLRLPFRKCIAFAGQACFHPMKYLYGLAEGFVKAGGILSQYNRAAAAEDRGDHCLVAARKGTVRARRVVYATHLPPGINLLHFYCAPYRSYVLGLRLEAEEQYPRSLVYDLHDPYHYFMSQELNEEKYLVLGGEDHKTGSAADTAASFSRLEAYARTYFNVGRVDFRWSSQYYIPADGLPYIGALPGSDSEYVATGFNGDGMTFGTFSGRLLADLILHGESPYRELFDPGRIKPAAAFRNLVKENTGVIRHFIGDRVAALNFRDPAGLKNGEAAVLRHNQRILAVYRSPQGVLRALDAVCPHARCLVQWNNAETSWDCPCHGSRFSPEGEPLTGPARSGLKTIDINP